MSTRRSATWGWWVRLTRCPSDFVSPSCPIFLWCVRPCRAGTSGGTRASFSTSASAHTSLYCGNTPVSCDVHGDPSHPDVQSDLNLLGWDRLLREMTPRRPCRRLPPSRSRCAGTDRSDHSDRRSPRDHHIGSAPRMKSVTPGEMTVHQRRQRPGGPEILSMLVDAGAGPS